MSLEWINNYCKEKKKQEARARQTECSIKSESEMSLILGSEATVFLSLIEGNQVKS